MTPTKEQIRRALALPIGWRGMLANQEGPGWWCREEQGLTCKLYEGSVGWGAHYTVDDGWAWLPADSLSWLRETRASYWAMSFDSDDLEIGNGRCAHIIDAQGDGWSAPDPIDAALAFMEAHNPPEPS
jgi:hypothetical protein